MSSSKRVRAPSDSPAPPRTRQRTLAPRHDTVGSSAGAEAAQSGKRQYPEIIEIKDDEDKRGNGKWKNNTFRKNQPRLGPADREVIEITDSEDDSENHDTTDISQQTRRLNPAKSTVSGTKNTDPSTHPKRDHPDLNNQRNHNLVDQLNRGPLLPDPNPDMNNDPGLDNSLRVDGRALAHPCDPQPQPLEDIESDDGAILDNDDHTVVTPTHTSNAQLPEEWEIGIGELVVSAILDIIPSVDLDELARVVEAHLINHGPDNIVEILIDQLLDGAEAAHHVDQLLEDVPAGNHDDRQSVECACCFDETPVTFCIQCPEGHHFCRRCITHYASRELGSQNTRLTCMDTGGCHAVFTSAGLANILSPTLLALFHRLELRRDLKEARLEGLEECPFCDWACIIEIPKDECIFFWCRNEEDCGVISCRLCRQKSHISFTCEEAETNKRVAGTHAIEEAMTEALKRHCPKCREAFIKEDGCNKITCPSCNTLSCYVCRLEITGYEHFQQMEMETTAGHGAAVPCPLWDDVSNRHAREVEDAYQDAVQAVGGA